MNKGNNLCYPSLARRAPKLLGKPMRFLDIIPLPRSEPIKRPKQKRGPKPKLYNFPKKMGRPRKPPKVKVPKPPRVDKMLSVEEADKRIREMDRIKMATGNIEDRRAIGEYLLLKLKDAVEKGGKP